MNLSAAEKLISKWKAARDRLRIYQAVKGMSTTYGSTVTLSANGNKILHLTKEEQDMIFRMLDNTISEKEQNYREKLKEELLIDVEV